MHTYHVSGGRVMEQGMQRKRRKAASGNAETGPCMECWWDEESKQGVEKRKPEHGSDRRCRAAEAL